MAGTAAEVTTATVPRQGAVWKPLPKLPTGKTVSAPAVQPIRASADQVYNLYARIEALPAWQEGVVSVERLGPKKLHWKMQDPGTGKQFEFDSEEVEKVPGKRHVSRVTTGVTAGTVQTLTLAAHPSGRGTVATIVADFVVPTGWVGNAVSSVVSRSPAQLTVENLRHLKEMLEAGEIPTVEGQSAGRRGISGKLKQLLYGENMPTPPGTTDRARPEDMPEVASSKSSTWPTILASAAAVAVFGALLYVEGRDD